MNNNRTLMTLIWLISADIEIIITQSYAEKTQRFAEKKDTNFTNLHELRKLKSV